VLAVDRDQALAFRVAGHNVHARTDPLTAVAACAIQESPPGWWRVALHARAEGDVDSGKVLMVNAMRGAPHVVPVADAAVFTSALVPGDDGLKALIGSLVAKEVTEGGHSVREAVDLVMGAAREGLADGALGRDNFHQAMRERLPDTLLPWCRGCQSHHVRPGLWRALGPLGVTVMPDKATYALAPAASAEDAQHRSFPIEKSRAELVRRFLRCFGPATHTQLASWAQTAPAYAKELFATLDEELEPVKADGRKGFVLCGDVPRLEDPPAAEGVRLLGGFDPYVSQPDRDSLAPETALRKRMFPAVGRPGVVLNEGELRGLWKGRKKGDRLDIEVTWLGKEVDIADEAAAIASLRGCETARVTGGAGRGA